MRDKWVKYQLWVISLITLPSLFCGIIFHSCFLRSTSRMSSLPDINHCVSVCCEVTVRVLSKTTLEGISRMAYFLCLLKKKHTHKVCECLKHHAGIQLLSLHCCESCLWSTCGIYYWIVIFYLWLIQGSLNLAEQIFVHSLSHILVYLELFCACKKHVYIYLYIRRKEKIAFWRCT